MPSYEVSSTSFAEPIVVEASTADEAIDKAKELAGISELDGDVTEL